MNAFSWDHGVDIRDMLRAVESQPSSRKNRLFSCTCARRIPELIRDDRLRNCVDVAESFADWAASKEQLKTARKEGRRLLGEIETPGRILTGLLRLPDQTIAWDNLDLTLRRGREEQSITLLARRIAVAVCDTSTPTSPHLAPVVWWSYHSLPPDGLFSQREIPSYCNLLREIFGNPFCPVTLDPAWRTEAAVGIAQAAYDSREFGNLPILADALQDAGCDHPDILAHLRGPGPHVRGCWVVDLVLGKA